MTLLAIDTSTSYGGIALYDGGTVLAEEGWHMLRGHDAAVFAGVDRLLALTGLAMSAIDRVAVANGPGSFTGVRVAIATAQGIARGSGARTAAVSTLDVIAHPWSTAGRRVCAVLPAGRDELCAATYRISNGKWERNGDLFVGSAGDLARVVRSGALFAGEIDASAREVLTRELGSAATFAPSSMTPRRAGCLAEIGWARFEAGEGQPAEALEPLYIRAAMIGPAGKLERGSGSAALRAQGPLPLQASPPMIERSD